MSVAIIGGGISGLALAYCLARKGVKVSIYEQADRLGGVGTWLQLGDVFVDSFYHVLTDGDTPLRQIIRDIGLDEKVFPVKLTQGFFQDDKLFPASSVKDLLSFAALSFSNRLRLGFTIATATVTNNWHSLDRKSARDWLIGLGGADVYEHFWRPIMTCRFGSAVEQIAAADMWYRIHRTGEVTLRRANSGSCYIQGGLRTLFTGLESTLKELGVKVHLNASVEKFVVENNRIAGIKLSNGNLVDSQQVVSAAPVQVFARLIPEEFSDYRAKLNRIKYLGNVCLILKTTHPISPFYQLNLGHPDIPFTGVIGADCLYPPKAYGGYLTYITRYFQESDELYSLSAEELLNTYLPFLTKICPDFRRDWIKDMAVTRTRFADHLHVVGYGDLVPEYKTPIDGLYLLSMAQVYPEPTVLDTAITNAYKLAMNFL